MRSTLHGGGECSRMSELPNDILVSIISRLTLREATATCILSHRWRYLHTYITRLDFPSFTPILFDRSEDAIKSQERRFRDHVKMIDGVMDSHRGGRGLKELKMHMYSIEGANFNKWMEFALTKDIETIDIGMHRLPPRWPESTPRARYSLGLPRFITSETALRCLKQLSLTRVYTDEQDLELLVSHCVNLETLRIYDGVFALKRMSIVGHPKLRHVDIRSDLNVKSIEIRDLVNLVTLGFHYLSAMCVLDLHNVPNLTQLHTTEHGGCTPGHTYVISRIPSCIRCQLQSLHVSSPDFCMPGNPVLDYGFVNVKHLEVEVRSMTKQVAAIFQLYHLIRACPSVEKLMIKFAWRGYELKKFGGKRRIKDKYDPNLEKLFPNLKVVEMEGYAGCKSELKLASYIISNAENLEKLIVVACDETDTIRKSSIARAQQDFGRITPPALGLQIIIY